MSIFANSKKNLSFKDKNYDTPEPQKFDRSGYSYHPYEENTLNKIKGYLVPTNESKDFENKEQVVIIGKYFLILKIILRKN